MTPEERALEAAWKACSAWDGKITKPVLRKVIEAAVSEARAAALEEAAKMVQQMPRLRQVSTEHVKSNGPADYAAAIRALIPMEEGSDG